MASLLDEVLGQSGWDPTPLLQLPDERPPSLQPDPRADALGQTYQAVTDYLARKHQEGVDAGNWEGGWPWEGGHPTWKAAKGAVDAYAQGMQAGTLKGPGPFTTYQGSPHKFAPTPKNPLGEFSDERIGTGTGGQSEGMGHYTAENEAVAKHYRALLSKRNSPEQVALAMDLETNAGLQMPVTSGIATAKNPRQEAADFARVLERTPSHWPDYTDRLAQAAKLRAHLPNIPEEAVPPPGSGHMYEVKINADPDKYLRWDHPLREQHPDVIEALKKTPYPPHDLNITGKQYLTELETNREMMSKEGDPAALASQALKEAGIPGIRYFDASSRRKGEGTHNYVTFDPAKMEIIRRYGLAGLMLGGGGLLSPDRQER
jgi:hypothetical protein